MPVDIHIHHAPIELVLRGNPKLEDLDALVEAAGQLTDRTSRPGLVIDASRANLAGVVWSQTSRDAMLEFLRAVGCVAIVAEDALTVQAAKIALDPLGSAVVWRVFPDLESARIWVFSVERLAQNVWSKAQGHSFAEHRLNRLEEIVKQGPSRGRPREELKRQGG